MLYMDNGPIGKSLVFHRVMDYLGIEVRTAHAARTATGLRPTARAKGKVERPFRSVKEMHETLYHLHAPETEAEANAWLLRFLIHYNRMPHRREPHARIDDWLANLPAEGVRAMCSWERFCTFAREPERRKVGVDARVSLDGDPLRGRSGPGRRGGHALVGPVRQRALCRARRAALRSLRAGRRPDPPASLPLASRRPRPSNAPSASRPWPNNWPCPGPCGAVAAATRQDRRPGAAIAQTAFVDPDPFQEIAFPTAVAAKRAIAEYLGTPLAKLPAEAWPRSMPPWPPPCARPTSSTTRAPT